MTLSRLFTTEDTTLYPSWQKEEGGIVILFIPGIGEVRMTLDKADEVSEDLARQAEYGRWYVTEKIAEKCKEIDERSKEIDERN